jgi:hypothetical protein
MLPGSRLLPALVARGGPLHVGPSFVGSPDVGGADGDAIVGGLLVEWKATRGDRRHSDGRRYCRLDGDTLHQLLGYLLLDYQDEFAIDTLALYSARYAYLVSWPIVELLTELVAGRSTWPSFASASRRPPGAPRRPRAC